MYSQKGELDFVYQNEIWFDNVYRKNNMNKRMKNYVPDEWALEIISESELNMLKELERED